MNYITGTAANLYTKLCPNRKDELCVAPLEKKDNYTIFLNEKVFNVENVIGSVIGENNANGEYFESTISNEKIQKSPIIGLKANQNGSLSMIVLDEKFNLERQMDCEYKHFVNFLNTYGLNESQLYEVIVVDKGDSAKLTVRKYNSSRNYRYSLGTFITGIDAIQFGLYSALVVIPTSKMICNCVLDAVQEQHDVFLRPEFSTAMPTAVGFFLEYIFYDVLKFFFQTSDSNLDDDQTQNPDDSSLVRQSKIQSLAEISTQLISFEIRAGIFLSTANKVGTLEALIIQCLFSYAHLNSAINSVNLMMSILFFLYVLSQNQDSSNLFLGKKLDEYQASNFILPMTLSSIYTGFNILSSIFSGKNYSLLNTSSQDAYRYHINQMLDQYIPNKES